MKDIEAKPGDVVFRTEYDISNALEWQLYKKSLQQELTDDAEELGDREVKVNGKRFSEVEATARIGVKPGAREVTGKFVVEFVLD